MNFQALYAAVKGVNPNVKPARRDEDNISIIEIDNVASLRVGDILLKKYPLNDQYNIFYPIICLFDFAKLLSESLMWTCMV